MTDVQKATALRWAASGVLIGGTLTPLLIVLVFHGEVSWVTPWVLLMLFGAATLVSGAYQRRFENALAWKMIQTIESCVDDVNRANDILVDHDKILSNRFNIELCLDTGTGERTYRIRFEE